MLRYCVSHGCVCISTKTETDQQNVMTCNEILLAADMGLRGGNKTEMIQIF